jgi:hypothetical protein
VLVGGSRLGLCLGLSSTLGQRLGGERDNLVGLGGTNNNLNLDRATIDEETVQFLEGRASAIGLAEDDRSDATALRVGAVGEFNPLDGANNLDEVFLSGARSVSELRATCVCVYAKREPYPSIDHLCILDVAARVEDQPWRALPHPRANRSEIVSWAPASRIASNRGPEENLPWEE